ncbi:SPOR domain-containing protein [Reinekea blandensis]|uniref:Cell division protein n=1 Tax=Reinekea blandensis MED297 TaxID=314283 RepID=A4BGC4_9GAMM|nr:SPOR domain-containing protein [Reinekea blandensis]EAR08919.1 Cell division protein [Reinekea sp. MED297] [Reinekea blandensis MED297]
MARDFAHKPKQQPEGSRIPRWVWLFTSTVAIGFVGFLYYLSQVPEETTGADAVRQQLSQALAEQPATETEPVATEERESLADIKEKADTLKKAFEFYELLENDEVPIDLPGDEPATPSQSPSSGSSPTTTAAIPTASSWIIQVASFSNVADADKVRAELILNGLPNTDIVSVDVAGKGTFHRVMVGPFSHRPTLNKAQDILAELNYTPLVKSQ